MKQVHIRSIAIISLILFATLVKAQATIKPKTGEEIKAKILSTEGDEVTYKFYYWQEGQSFKLAKSEINYIQFPDGHVEYFDQPKAQTPVTPPGANEFNAANNGSTATSAQNDAATEALTKQTATLGETLKALNNAISSLKSSIDKNAEADKSETAETNKKLDAINASLKDMKGETESNKEKEESITPRKFGMGVNLITNAFLISVWDVTHNPYFDNDAGDNGVDMTDLSSALFVGGGLNMSISGRLFKKVAFRYEPEIAVVTASNSLKVKGDHPSRASLTTLSFGSRFLALKRFNRVNIFAGPSFTILAMIRQDNDTGGKKTTASPGIGFGLHFGGEYLVHSNFGIVLESGMQLYSFFTKRDGAQGTYTQGIFSTYARLGGRFYF